MKTEGIISEAHVNALKDVVDLLDKQHHTQQSTADQTEPGSAKDDPSSSTLADSAFRKALDANPKLVALETPADRFLRTSDGSVEDTADRLCRYWSLRNHLFNNNNNISNIALSSEDSGYSDFFHRQHLDGGYFHRPLTIVSGRGALRSADDEVFKSGFLVNLPNAADGRPVICLDRSLLQRDFDNLGLTILPNIMRCVFYVLSIAAAETRAASAPNDGLVVLVVHHVEHSEITTSSTSTTTTTTSNDDDGNTARVSFDEELQKGMYELIKIIFPINVSTEVVMVIPRTGSPTPSQNRAADSLERLSNRTFDKLRDNSKCQITADYCKRELMRSLIKRSGLKSAKATPSTIGGSWGYFGDFCSWRRRRVVVEELLEAEIADNLTEEIRQEILAKDAAKKRKRQQDVEYARRKRQKGKFFKKDLVEQVKALNHRKKLLKQESEELNMQLVDAKRQVAAIESERARILQSINPQAVVSGHHHHLHQFGDPAVPAEPHLMYQHPALQQLLQTPYQQALASATPASHHLLPPPPHHHQLPMFHHHGATAAPPPPMWAHHQPPMATTTATFPHHYHHHLPPGSGLPGLPPAPPPNSAAAATSSTMKQLDAEIQHMMRLKEKISEVMG